jgi:rubrerythrin
MVDSVDQTRGRIAARNYLKRQGIDKCPVCKLDLAGDPDRCPYCGCMLSI